MKIHGPTNTAWSPQNTSVPPSTLNDYHFFLIKKTMTISTSRLIIFPFQKSPVNFDFLIKTQQIDSKEQEELDDDMHKYISSRNTHAKRYSSKVQNKSDDKHILYI